VRRLARPNPRTTLAFVHDTAAATLCWIGAFWLRLNLELPHHYLATIVETVIWVVPLQAVVFWGFGLYRGIWRYASIPDLKRIIFAATLSAAAIATVLLMLQLDPPVPRSVLLLDPLLLVLLMGGSRMAYRVWKDGRIAATTLSAKPVLVLGGGDAGANLVKQLEHSHEWRVVGILDDNAAKQQRLIHGVKVLGPIDSIGQWAEKFEAAHAVIALPGASPPSRRRAYELCAQHGLQTLIVPTFADLMSGRVTVSALRNVELEDLLGRNPVQLDNRGLSTLLGGAVVLVTGAGGSIGSELCRQVLRFGPARLVCLDHSEFALYTLEQELARGDTGVDRHFLVGDVKDRDRVREVLERFRPQVVFHSAAYKHVPLMEDENAAEALANNVIGTWVVANEARRASAKRFVLISTDKAVNPTNVMGASKRLCERVCQALNRDGPTRFVMVRFGNVLGSAGSVIPKFREQIARGGPVTVTHPDIERFFMSIPEASQLVLQASFMGQGGEIFVLDMGEPIRIADLARDMIRLSGLDEEEVRVEFTGLRPGEKLYEELFADGEAGLPTPHPKLRIARTAEAPELRWAEQLVDWVRACRGAEHAAIKAGLRDWLPEYRTTVEAPPAAPTRAAIGS
jgi:FlaA1/EpsC-like NDP-sugar epimerase